MKKKIILLLILVISLFIYSSRANAVVMWRECGSIQDESKFYFYNFKDLSLVFVRFTADESGTSVTLPLFKNQDYIRSPYPFYSWDEGGTGFEEGFNCPIKTVKISVSDSDFINEFANKFSLNFAGSRMQYYDNSTSYKRMPMDGYQLAIYKMQGVNNIYIMEVYDKDGTYGIIMGNDMISFLKKLDGDLSEDASVLANNSYGIQIAKLIRGNEKYFKITDPTAKVLFGDVLTLWQRIAHEVTNGYMTDYANWKKINMLNIKYNRGLDDDTLKSMVDYDAGILYSTPTDPNVWPVVGKWADKVKGNVNSDVVEQYNSIFANGGKYNDTYKEVMKISESIDKNNSYSFPDDFDFESFINKMIETKGTSNKEGPLDIILNYDFSFPAYDEDCNSDDVHTNNGVTSLGGYVSCQYFGTSQAGLDDRTIGFNSSRVVFNVFQQAILTQLENYKKKNPDLSILGYFEESENYLIALATVASYIQTNYAQYDDLLNDFVTECKDELRQRGIEIVIDCNSLLGDKLISKIGKYVNIIKIAVPIILILFGIFDFAKAMLAGDDDKMKKAQKSFMIRIAIAVLFFLTPYIVKLLLSIANKVWGFIKPNNCNIWTSK